MCNFGRIINIFLWYLHDIWIGIHSRAINSTRNAEDSDAITIFADNRKP